jgi:hypothetical protein
VSTYRAYWTDGSSTRQSTFAQWEGDTGGFKVQFDESGRARQWWFWDGYRVEQSPFELLLWRIKRQWHRWFP